MRLVDEYLIFDCIIRLVRTSWTLVTLYFPMPLTVIRILFLIVGEIIKYVSAAVQVTDEEYREQEKRMKQLENSFFYPSVSTGFQIECNYPDGMVWLWNIRTLRVECNSMHCKLQQYCECLRIHQRQDFIVPTIIKDLLCCINLLKSTLL